MKKLFVATDDPYIYYYEDGDVISCIPVNHDGFEYIVCFTGNDAELVGNHVRTYVIIAFDDATLDSFDARSIELFRDKTKDLERDDLPFMMGKNIQIINSLPIPA